MIGGTGAAVLVLCREPALLTSGSRHGLVLEREGAEVNFRTHIDRWVALSQKRSKFL